MSMNMIPFLDLKAQHAQLKPELLKVFDAALDTAGFIGGEHVAAFEREFAAFCGAGANRPLLCAGVGNGTEALRLALLGLGIGRGDLVLTVPNTFIATVEAISHTGAHFAFVDVDPATSLMDANLLEAELKRRFASPRAEDRPKAILPVHLYGQCADMTAILKLAEQYGLKVVEDAAQAHGASHNGHLAGSMGHAAGFSFYPGKNLGACGDAGAVVSADPAVMERVRMLRDHGQSRKYFHALEGMNSRLDAIQAGFLRVKLPHLAAWNESRRATALCYDAAFAKLPWLSAVRVMPGNVPSRHLYVVHLHAPADRDELARVLKEQDIHTGLHYPHPLHLQECYASLGLGPGSFPVAEKLARELISLPMFPGMTPEQVERVIAAVTAYGDKLPG